MKKIYRKFCELEVIICSVFLIIVVTLVFLSAITRKFGVPMQKSLEVAQLLFAWLAFIGADIALRNENLVGVDLFTKKLEPKIQIYIKLICHVLIIGLLLIFFIKGLTLSIQNWTRTFQSLKMSYSLVTLSLPIGSLLMILSSVQLILKDFSKLKELKGE